MAGDLHENAEKQTLAPAGVQSDAASLSQNTQTLFTAQSGIRAASEPISLDFGNPTSLYGKDNVIAQIHLDSDETMSQAFKRFNDPPPPEMHIGEQIKHAFRAGMDSLPGHQFSVESFMHERPALAQAVELSPTLKAAMSERVPWQDKLSVNYKWESPFTDFKLHDFSINMLKGWDNQKLIETFGHELYHAKHQDLDKLYGAAPIDDPVKYRDIKMNQEAGAFLQEFKVHEELKTQFKDSKPAVFEYIDQSGQVRQKPVGELIQRTGGKIDDEASKANIAQFLLSHDAPQKQDDGTYQKNADGSLVRNSYKALYEGERYQEYLSTFNTRKQELAPYLGKGY